MKKTGKHTLPCISLLRKNSGWSERLCKRLIPALVFALPLTLAALNGAEAKRRRRRRGQSTPPKKTLQGRPLNAQGAVFKSVQKELQRNKEKLKLKDEVIPYFLGVSVKHHKVWYASASLGALLFRTKSSGKKLSASIRVGSYKQDNTGYYGIYPRAKSAGIPIEPNDLALRRALYFSLDRAYKYALRGYSRKQAYLRSHPRKDLPPAWTKVSPVSHEEVGRAVTIVPDRWVVAIKKASAVFRKHPRIQKSSVTVSRSETGEYLLTSEGLRYYRSAGLAGFVIAASALAEDGMKLRVSWKTQLTAKDTAPEKDEILKAAQKVAARLEALLKAPKMGENYSGPVLFQGGAATAFVTATMARSLSANAMPVRWSKKGILEGMKGRPILPKWVSIVDDPAKKRHKGKNLAGHYEVDHEGVKAQRVELVKKGILTDLLSCRRPTTDSKESNGHGRGLFGMLSSVAMPSNFIVRARRGLSKKRMKRRFLKLLKKKGLEHGYIIKKSRQLSAYALIGYSRSRNIRLPQPLEVYRVDLKGKETLVRGVKAESLPISELERLVAMGKKPKVSNIWLRPGFGVSVVAPDLLVDRVELGERTRRPTRKPILSSPLK